MSAATLIYLAGMCDSLSTALILICIVGAIATGVSVIVYFSDAGSWREQEQEFAKRIRAKAWLLWLWVPLILIAVLLPSKETLYAMYTVDALQSNQTVQQIESTAPKVLLKFLNGYLKDDKK